MTSSHSPQTVLLTNNESNQHISNTVHAPIIITNNIETGLPPILRFSMGLLIPVFLLIIPFSFFSIEESLGDELNWSYGETERIIALENTDDNQYFTNYSMNDFDLPYNDTIVFACTIMLPGYGGYLYSPSYGYQQNDDFLYIYRCDSRGYLFPQVENSTDMIQFFDYSEQTIEIENGTDSVITYSMNLSNSEKLYLETLRFLFFNESGEIDSRFTYSRENSTLNNMQIYFIENYSDVHNESNVLVGSIYDNGTLFFNNSANISYVRIKHMNFRLIGNWTNTSIQFNDGNYYGENINITMYAGSYILYEEEYEYNLQLMEEQRHIASLGYISCCAILLISLILTIYGFASRGGIPMAIGGLLSFAICPIIFVIPANLF